MFPVGDVAHKQLPSHRWKSPLIPFKPGIFITFLLLFLVTVSSHSPLCLSFGLMILTLAQKIFFTIGQQLTTFLKLLPIVLGPGFYWTILLDFTFSLYVFSLVDLFPDMIEIGLVHCFTNKNLPRRQLPDSISFHFSHFCLF